MTPPDGAVAGATVTGLSWRPGFAPRVCELAESDDSTEDATARFDRAMARLEASVRSLNGRVRAHARIEADTQKLIAERQRFASELDKQSARAKRLDDSAHEVSRRLVEAMETVRGVLAK
jgi:Domain of unknown function (DUF4164)